MKRSLLLPLALIGCLLTFFSVNAQPVAVTKTNPVKVYVHYMPWFSAPQNPGSGTTSYGNAATGTPNKWGTHWTNVNSNTKFPDDLISVTDYTGATVQVRDIISHYHPLIGPYDEQDPNVLEYHLLLMKLSGIDGVLIDWYGQTGSNSDVGPLLNNSNALIAKAPSTGLKFGLVMEDHFWSSLSVGQTNGTYAIDNYFNQSSYITLGDMRGSGATNATSPLVCVFGPQTFKTPGQWNTILGGNTGCFLPLSGQSAGIGADAAGEFAWPYPNSGSPTTYNSLTNYYATSAASKNVVLGVGYPGFNDFYGTNGANQYGLIPRIVNGITTLKGTLNQYTAYSSVIDGIQLATWNDFTEGTIIEPTVEEGFQSLDTIQKFTGVSYTELDLKQVYRLFTLRKKYIGDAVKQSQLDQVFNYFVALQIPQAVALMNIVDGISAPGTTVSISSIGAPSENGATGQFVITATSDTSNITVYYTVGGTATTAHYTANPTLVDSVLLTPTNYSDTITIAAIDDNIVNPGETVKLTLTADTAYTIGTNSATLTIIDNETPNCTGPMIVNTNAAPVIDGAADSVWTKAPKNLIAQTISGTIQTGSTWQAMYDTTNLYVLVNVKDSNLSSNGNPTGYDQDGVEIMISGNNSKAGLYTSSDHQYRFNWNVFPYSTANIIGATTNSKVGIVYAIPATTGGYTLEVAIPWTTIGGTTPAPFNGKEIGFDININDQQNGAGPREATVGWYGTNNDDYTNTAGFGVATVTICNGDTTLAAPIIRSVATVKDTANTPFSFTVLADNSPSSYGAANLPAGLTINAATGLISGMATTYGVFTATVSATNAAGTGTATLTINIDSLPAVTSLVTATGKVGVAFTYAISASHNPTSYAAANLPGGLTVNTATGAISGKPTTSGVFITNISATNDLGTTSTTLTITVDTSIAVRFISISAARQAATIAVQWTVDSEVLVKQYEIQRSTD
ncbi:MAG TPA: sugar-binding protein, partial [Ferruginibacter sp.]|nr:sugar-binding protein [Ferruginibacter sp.]